MVLDIENNNEKLKIIRKLKKVMRNSNENVKKLIFLSTIIENHNKNDIEN